MNRDYEWLFEHSNVAMVLLDQKGRYLDHNKAYRELMGYTDRNELFHFHQENVSARIQPNGKSSKVIFANNLARAFKEGRYEFAWLHERTDGVQFMSLVVLEKVIYREQECLLVTIQDIDEKDKVKRLVKEQVEEIRIKNSMLEAIFTNAREGMLVIDRDENIIKCNQRIQEIIGCSEAILCSKGIRQFFVDDTSYTNFRRNYIKAILDDGLGVVEYEFKNYKGEKIWCTLSGCRLYGKKNQKENATLWMVEDTTEQKRMAKALEVQYQIAKDASPLTGLPGNNSIMAYLSRIVSNKENMCILYIDIDNFKSFNDKYGFANGDNVLKMVGNMIKDIVDGTKSLSSFVGHIGGDDFVVSIDSSYMVQTAMAIVQEFDRCIGMYYSNEDMKMKSIVAIDRDGIKKIFPLMSISIAGVDLRDVRQLEYLEIIDICTELKKKAKSIDGSCYVFNKRKA